MNLGHINDMLGRLKSNASLIGRDRFALRKYYQGRYRTQARFVFRKGNEKEIALLRAKLRREARQDRLRLIIALIIVTLIAFALITWLYRVLL